jgi:acetyl-CoA C-acetyltransferase
MKASREAYINAGLRGPDGIDIFEISDITPFHYLMELEAIGLSPPGRGARLLERGEVGPENARIIVNPDGGSLCTDPYPAGGLLKVYEAYLQLTGEAGAIQCGEPSRALVHGFSYLSGASAQTHIVSILSR